MTAILCELTRISETVVFTIRFFQIDNFYTLSHMQQLSVGKARFFQIVRQFLHSIRHATIICGKRGTCRVRHLVLTRCRKDPVFGAGESDTDTQGTQKSLTVRVQAP